MTTPLRTPNTPCASCPYRTDVPSGVWHYDEYEKLRAYDEDPNDPDKAIAAIGQVFLCHQPIEDAQAVCRGWAEVHYDTPAVRMTMLTGTIDPETLREPPPGIEFFPSGAAAADHGQAEIDAPGVKAHDAITKVEALRASAERRRRK